jgi:hypothetical protein
MEIILAIVMEQQSLSFLLGLAPHGTKGCHPVFAAATADRKFDTAARSALAVMRPCMMGAGRQWEMMNILPFDSVLPASHHTMLLPEAKQTHCCKTAEALLRG